LQLASYIMSSPSTLLYHTVIRLTDSSSFPRSSSFVQVFMYWTVIIPVDQPFENLKKIGPADFRLKTQTGRSITRQIQDDASQHKQCRSITHARKHKVQNTYESKGSHKQSQQSNLIKPNQTNNSLTITNQHKHEWRERECQIQRGV
jgi:hypothetical protein